jgi:7,8-dihydro-6-hydroxymethylpterin dimethyltransferase
MKRGPVLAMEEFDQNKRSLAVAFQAERWTRLEHEGNAVYVDPATPNWFIPNKAGDRILQTLPTGMDVRRSAFLQRLPESPPANYSGRAEHLQLQSLRELWLHVTDRCNLKCTHCLFTSGAHRREEMPIDRMRRYVGQASALGCRVFALTGGEPFVHPDFEEIVDELLELPDAAVAVLTNGTLLQRYESALRRWRHRRFHLQISVDGLAASHNAIRGDGSHAALTEQLKVLRRLGMAYTISVCVTCENVADLPALVDYCAEAAAANLHLMWYFVRGRGDAQRWVHPDAILPHLLETIRRAERKAVSIDNIQALKTQAFAPSGTRHDGTGGGWESVAIGPDDHLYPSPAMVGVAELAHPVGDDLEAAWHESPPLERLRAATAATLDSPLRFLTGGGDTDHSFMHSRQFLGHDPYLPLYENLLLHLIVSQAAGEHDGAPPALRLKMGDILESCGAHGEVALTHSNCLLAFADADGRTAVKEFYSRAAATPKDDIRNPVHYADQLIAHIPEASRIRSYGCGSPVLDADLQAGESVVDLGSGSGVECFIASRLVGRQGSVIGIDMLDPMLDLSRNGVQGVEKNLGYSNIQFRKGYLEDLPLDESVVDVVISNCVMNLSTHKRRLFAEVFRILKPGGRLVVSDVVCETDPPAIIRNDDTLRGQCIGGALSERDLIGLLTESGFIGMRIIKRFPYRRVGSHPFFSLTFHAVKPAHQQSVRAIYRGPLAGVALHDGTYVPAGLVCDIPADELAQSNGQFLHLDEGGRVVNIELGASCCCDTGPEEQAVQAGEELCCVPRTATRAARLPSGCMVCGAALQYLSTESVQGCAFCGRESAANAICENGHFVCDTCHAEDALAVIEHICRTTNETDMVALMQKIRSHPAVPVNGPEHHALVPGIILATYRNLGGRLTDEHIRRGIQRGAQIPGGACAFLGACGAALGVGTAFAIILDANPLKGAERSTVQRATQRALCSIASLEAPRCCQRDVWLALRAAENVSTELLPVRLRAETLLRCTQAAENRECIGSACPVMQEPSKNQLHDR